MIQPRIPALLLVAFASLLGGCSQSSESMTSPGTPSVKWDTTYSQEVVSLTSTRLILRVAPLIYNYCNTTYSSDNQTSTTQLKVVGDQLWMGGDSFYIYPARLVAYQLLTRRSGSGVEGVWDYLLRDTIVPLNIAETDSVLRSERARRDGLGAIWNAAGEADRLELNSGSAVHSYKYPDPILWRLGVWPLVYGDKYDLTIRQVDASTLTYAAKDGTVATVRRLDLHHIEYSNSNATKYPTYVEEENVTSVSSCPANAWFYGFIFSYPKTTTAARILPTSIAPAHSTTLPRISPRRGMF